MDTSWMMLHEFQYLCQFTIFRAKHYATSWIYFSNILQHPKQEFWTTLQEAASSSSQFAELGEPAGGEDMEKWNSSPPMVIQLHSQHISDYVHIFMEEGECWLWVRIGQLPWLWRYNYFLSMFSAVNPPFLIQFFLCCPAPFINSFSGIAEDSFSQPYSKHG